MGAREDLKNRRIELGLTLEEVANIVGVGKSTVRKWETGFIANMKRDKIELYAKALKTTPIFIMGIEEDKKEERVSCASRIKEGMQKIDFKAADLVKITGISKATISQYLSGEYEPSREKAESIAKALHVTEAWLMGYDVQPARKGDFEPLNGKQKEMLKMFNDCSKDSQNRIMAFTKNVYEMEQAEQSIKKAEEIPVEYLNEEEMLKKYGPAIPISISASTG